MCAHICIYMCTRAEAKRRHSQVSYVARCYMCVLILLYMCPHTAMYVSSYYYICVLIVLYIYRHTAIYVSSYNCICVLILLYICSFTLVADELHVARLVATRRCLYRGLVSSRGLVSGMEV